MSQLIIQINPHLQKQSDLLLSIAKATVASFKLEGIQLSLEEALRMVKEFAAKARE